MTDPQQIPPPQYYFPPPRRGPKPLHVAAAVGLVVVLVVAALGVAIVIGKISVDFNFGSNDNHHYTFPDNATSAWKVYNWRFEGNSYTLRLNISAQEYYEYKDRSVDRSPSDTAVMAQYVTSSDAVVLNLTQKLEWLAQNQHFDNLHTLDFMLAFVQGIGYSYDNVSTGYEDYWRYSVETLYDHTGDCEDLAILYASVLEASGHDAVLLLFPGHMATGVDCPSATGEYYLYDSVDYFYCETTSPGWLVGELPPEMQGESATVIQVQ